MTLLESFIDRSILLSRQIINNKKAIKDILLAIESSTVVEDEIARSLDALQGMAEEFSNVKLRSANLSIAAFMPLNLPLYSLILFAVAPSFFARHLAVRPPELLSQTVSSLIDTMKLDILFPNISVKNIKRAPFTRLYVETADVVIFTGRYENAEEIRAKNPYALFIYNGSGINPVIVFDNADLELAADKICYMRLFNNGQDCAGTDLILVQQPMAARLVSAINQRIDKLVIGPSNDPKTDIGPVLRREYLEELSEFLKNESDHIVRQGSINYDSQVISPYIITKPLTAYSGYNHEFFAPVFYIHYFKNADEITVLNRPSLHDHMMYVSYFGDNSAIKLIDKPVLIHNQVVNDIEQGNQPYGGYGSKANFVAFGKKIFSRPILISREIDEFFTHDKLTG